MYRGLRQRNCNLFWGVDLPQIVLINRNGNLEGGLLTLATVRARVFDGWVMMVEATTFS